MSKLFGIILLLVSLYIGMSLYGKEVDRSVAGVFAPIESSIQRGDSPATHLTPGAQLADAPPAPARPRVRVTEQVRQRVTADIARGTSRSGYESP